MAYVLSGKLNRYIVKLKNILFYGVIIGFKSGIFNGESNKTCYAQ
jgi:hypothetical protein